MKNISRVQIVVFISIICIISFILTAGISGFHESGLRYLIRWTAKLAILLFCIAFGISSLHYFIDNKLTVTLLEYRSHIGLAFGTFHLFHLIFLILLQLFFHPVFELAKTTSIIGGSIAYGFVIMMMLTSFPSIKKTISPHNWRWAHIIGSFWIWSIFFSTSYRKVFTWDEGYFAFILICLVLTLRLFRIVHKNAIWQRS